MTAEAEAGRVSLYAVNAILARVDPMLKEIAGVVTADAESLHRMRVASRRLRMALRLLGRYAGLSNERAFFKLARAVTRTLGEARDIDVRISWLDEFASSCAPGELQGVRRVSLRLRQRREALQPKIVLTVARLAEETAFTSARQRLCEERLKAEMFGRADPLRDLAHATRVICLQLDALTNLSVSLASPEAVAAQHQMRIETKHLRYAMEILSGLYRSEFEEYIALARKLQTMLGDLHDADVWIEAMPVFIEGEARRTLRYYGSERPFARLRGGCEAIARDRAGFRASLYEKTRLFWDETREKGRWGELRESVIREYRERETGLSEQR